MARKKRTSEIPDPLRLVYMSPAELAENPRNWRTHPDAQVSALTDVIAEVGWAGACLFNERTGRLIDGHARKKVAVAQGCDKVPVLVGSWDEAAEAKILATLDPIAAMATADAARLDALLRDVSTGSEALSQMLTDLAGEAGLSYGRDTSDPGGGGDDFDATPDDGPCRVTAGDLWVIGGKHRLLCGDSTKAEDVARATGGEEAGLCFTSPPYAQQRDYGAKIADWDGLMCGVFGNLPMAGDGQVLVNLGLVHKDGEWWPYWDGWIAWMREQGWRRFGWYVWDQGPGLPGDWNGRLAPCFEFVFHFNRVSLRPRKTVPKKPENVRVPHRRTMRDADGETKAFSSPEKSLQPNKIPDAVIRVQRQRGPLGEGIDHPAPFSVAFASAMIESWPGDVYDPFLGSGTTLIAAHRLGRRCVGIELEPRYCEVVLRRAEAEGLDVEKS